MTPDELDAIWRRLADSDSPPYTAVPDTDIQALIDALREAGAARDSAWALLDQVREASGSILAERNRLRDERDESRAALDRANRLLRYAFTIRSYGERAPGGNETWAQFDRDCDEYLRTIEEES